MLIKIKIVFKKARRICHSIYNTLFYTHFFLFGKCNLSGNIIDNNVVSGGGQG